METLRAPPSSSRTTNPCGRARTCKKKLSDWDLALDHKRDCLAKLVPVWQSQSQWHGTILRIGPGIKITSTRTDRRLLIYERSYEAFSSTRGSMLGGLPTEGSSSARWE